jgi:hypothetical protein
MAQQAVVDAVTSRLTGAWTTTPIILANDDPAPPASGVAFVALQFPTARETFIAMAATGSRLMRENGTFRMVVAVPRGGDADTGRGYCGTLAALFRLQTFSGVVCFEASPPVENAGDVAGYWVLSISVLYQFDFFA